MPAIEEPMETGGEGTGQPTAQVWSAIKPQLEALQNDVVCLVPDRGIKNQIKQKFGAKEKSLKALLDEKMVEIISLASVPERPGSRPHPSRINFSDIRANLAEEWTQSLDALLVVVKNNPVSEQLMNEFTSRRDLYIRKVGSYLDEFEQQLVERLTPHGAFEPLDFNRQSLEADPPFGDDPLSQARNRIGELEDNLDQAERHIRKVEEDSQTLDGMLHARDQEIADLKKQLTPLSNVADVLRCETGKVQRSVFDLVSKITALEIDNDQLRKQANDPDSLQDHSSCQKQIGDLQAALELEQLNVTSSTKTIKDLRDMVDSLRDQLNKHGIRQPLDYRLQQLGLLGDPSDVDAASDSTSSDASNRYGLYGSPK